MRRGYASVKKRKDFFGKQNKPNVIRNDGGIKILHYPNNKIFRYAVSYDDPKLLRHFNEASQIDFFIKWMRDELENIVIYKLTNPPKPKLDIQIERRTVNAKPRKLIIR